MFRVQDAFARCLMHEGGALAGDMRAQLPGPGWNVGLRARHGGGAELFPTTSSLSCRSRSPDPRRSRSCRTPRLQWRSELGRQSRCRTDQVWPRIAAARHVRTRTPLSSGNSKSSYQRLLICREPGAPAASDTRAAPRLFIIVSRRSRSLSKLAIRGPSSERPRGSFTRIGSTKRLLTRIS
jgi:hypothetical protein